MEWNDLARALDPSLVMADIGLEPDPWQREALRSTARRVLMLASRQSGKSTTTACIAIHQATYTPGSLVLLFAPSQRQSGELFKKVSDSYHALGRPVPVRRELAFSLELENASRIIALPGDPDTIRGFSGPSLVIVDEAALAPDSLFIAVLPMLAVSGGRLLCLSTPFGRRGWFCDQWQAAGSDWEKIRAKATECPRIDREFLEEQKRLLGPRWFSQEFECEFVDAYDAVFSAESIEAMFGAQADDMPILAGF